MRQQPPPEHSHIHAADHEIPKKIPRRKPLNHAAATRVAPDALGPSHGLALLIRPDDPERKGVDQAALHQRHDVHVPVQLRARRQRGVGGGEEPPREEGREVGVDAVVEEEGGEDLVRVQRERGQAEEVGDGLREGGEEGGRGEEGVEHGWRALAGEGPFTWS